MKKRHSLDSIFRPESVAVIGASQRRHSLGYEILNNIISSDYNGKVFPVNPHAGQVHSVRAYRSVLDIEDEVEMAVIVIPKERVLGVVRECGKKGVKGIVVISAGFREVGGEGIALEKKLMRLVRKYDMRMVGPNCMGILNTDPSVSLNASFAKARPEPGEIGFLSQSGALGEAILSHAKNLGIGISMFVSIGNKPDISGNDLLEYWENDDSVSLILMYLESFGNPRKFTQIARRVSRKKPIIAVKAGRTVAGARATISHTGAMAGMDVATGALFSQCGVVRVTSINEMFDVSKAFLSQPVPRGGKVAVLSNAGGPAIMATDASARLGLDVFELCAATQRKLRKVLPAEAAVVNPVDMIATSGPDRYCDALRILLSDEDVDSVIVVFIPPVNIDAPGVARVIAECTAETDKTVLSVFMARSEHEKGVEILRENGVPVYLFPEAAAKALAAMVRRRQWLDRPRGRIKTVKSNRRKVASIMRRARSEGRRMLTTPEAFSVLDAYGIRSVRSIIATSEETAAAAAGKLGYPVALKVDSAEVTHKSDVGGVMLDLRSELEVRGAYGKMRANMKRAGMHASGFRVLVQEMISGGVETILGMQENPHFGPLLMFGLGGIHVEVLKDVSFRITPITDVDAREMVASIRGYPLLTGIRGKKPVSESALVDALQRLSQLVTENQDIAEMDVNPFIVREKPKTPVAVDVRIRLTEN